MSDLNSTVAHRISQAFSHWSLRRRQFDGTSATLDALYKQPDPWDLANREQHRFEATNALIAQHCPHPASILEIGCGEGYQTRYFTSVADQVTGIDVSGRALQRARAAVPAAVFLEGRLGECIADLPRRHYAIATLCDVLVYCPDQAELIDTAKRCADRVLVTNYAPQSRRIEPLCQGDGWQALPIIQSGRKRWMTYMWTAAARP